MTSHIVQAENLPDAPVCGVTNPNFSNNKNTGTTKGLNPHRGSSFQVASSVSLSWRNVEVKVKIKNAQSKVGKCLKEPTYTEKAVLKGVTGIAKPGVLLAIMGSSGAGKTTLMNVLTARNVRNLTRTGDILVNGYEVGKGIKNISAYVQQDDLFIGTLTVREQLQFRAMLRMDRGLTKPERLDRVEDVIIDMGLTKCADSQIGGMYGNERSISGGERKRLSFASEALTNPPLMFCDEPTSGLDTFMAQNIVNVLKLMADGNHTVLCTIHQPSSEIFAMFNQILLLSEGRTAFCGSQADAMNFFSRLNYICPTNFNPADHFIITLAIQPGNEEESKRKSKEICDVFESTVTARNIKADVNRELSNRKPKEQDAILSETEGGDSRLQASWITQTRHLFWRSWVTQFRDTLLIKLRFLQSLVFAVVFGLIYFQMELTQGGVMSINGAIFVLIIHSSFGSMFSVLNSFPLEIGIFYREHGSGLYRSDIYFFTKTLSDIPMFVVISVVFVTIAYWMMNLYNDMEVFLWCHVVYFLVSACAVSFGYFISVITSSVTIALALAPPLLIPCMLFGGLFINDSDIPVYFIWLRYVSWFRYANEILMVNQWENVDSLPCNNHTRGGNRDRCLFRHGKDVLEYAKFSRDNVEADLYMLVVLMVVFRLLAFLSLAIKARHSEE